MNNRDPKFKLYSQGCGEHNLFCFVFYITLAYANG